MSTQEQDIIAQQPSSPMAEKEFAARIRAKYPGMYDALDDAELSRRVLKKYPEYQPHVRLSDSALKPSVTSRTREDVDFNAPLPPAVEEFKPAEFTPFHNSDMNIPARLAAGAAELGGADNPANRSPATDPDLYGKPVTLSIKSQHPTDDEMADALFASISPAALKVNQRYRAETGHNLALPAVDRLNLEQYQDSSGSYQIPIAPTQELYRAINAYGHGGMQELESEISRMQSERQQIADAESKRKPEDVSPLRKGVADTMIGVSRLMNNVKGVVSSNPGEVARDAQFIQDAQRSIPEPQTTTGRIVRGVTGGVTSLPLYMNPAAPVVAYTQNLDRGQEQAVESALPLVVAGGVGRGVGAATREMSPVARQFLSRGSAGLTNAGIAYASGERDPQRLAEAGAVGALLPVGESGEEEEPEFASTRPLADAPLTPSMRAAAGLLPLEELGRRAPRWSPERGNENAPRVDEGTTSNSRAAASLPQTPGQSFTHPLFGELTVTEDQTGVPRGQVRVRDADGTEFPLSVGNAETNNSNAPAADARTQTATEKISNVLNVPRGIQTSLDTHSLFRQAAVSFGSHPIQTLRTYFQSLPALWNEEYAGKMLNEIQSSPLAPLRQEAGLYLSDYLPNSKPLSAREENFMSNLIGRIPGVRGTQRQFVTFLDKVRADAFDNYVTANPDATPETLRGIARFINYSTGRGDLGSFGERHALGLSNIFYSPRFALSRVELATTPFRGTPEARAFATRELVRYVSTNVGLMLLARAGGLQVGINPLSNDFGTVKVGNTRVSLWGGMDKTARYTAQLLMGESADANTDSTRDRSRLETARTFIRTKLAPQFSVLVDVATGKDFKGQTVTAGSEAKHLFLPISWGEIADAVKEDQRQGGSGLKGAAALPALVGASAQTFEEGPGANPNLQDERRRLRLPESKSPAIDNALSGIVTHQSYKVMPSDDARSRVLRTVQKAAVEDEAAGLSPEAVRLNAAVNAQVTALRSLIDAEKSLTPEQREQLEHEVNSRFFYARVKPGDRRELSAVQRVFGEQSKDSEKHLRERIEALKSKSP